MAKEDRRGRRINYSRKELAEYLHCAETSVDYKKIYSDSELEEDSTIRNFRIVQTEGSRQVTRDTKHYNLQMIIAVGFKVNNERAVQFRKWTNGIVKDYTIKGWVMDDECLKNGGSVLTVEYFDRLLEQIREIRLSERRFYQKITDIYATALDYDRTAKTTKQFFAKVQNKMHYAVHGHTAAELIYERADADKPHMLLEIAPEENNVIVNLHNWNGSSCISQQAYELSDKLNVKLLDMENFYGYINGIKYKR